MKKRSNTKYLVAILATVIGLTACGKEVSISEKVSKSKEEVVENIEEIESSEMQTAETDSDTLDMTPEQYEARADFFKKYSDSIEAGISNLYLESEAPSSIKLIDVYVKVDNDINKGYEVVSVYFIYKSANNSGTDLIKHYDCYETSGVVSFYEHDENKEMYIKHIKDIDDYFTRKENVSEPFEEITMGYNFKGVDEYTVYAPDYLKIHTIPEEGTLTVERECVYYKLTEEQKIEMQVLIEKLNE